MRLPVFDAGTFVVQIGDMFARWTNDRYRATRRPAVNRSGRDRHAMPFLFQGNPGHPVVALARCVPPNGHAPPDVSVNALLGLPGHRPTMHGRRRRRVRARSLRGVMIEQWGGATRDRKQTCERNPSAQSKRTLRHQVLSTNAQLHWDGPATIQPHPAPRA